jgi:hypothetical protein
LGINPDAPRLGGALDFEERKSIRASFVKAGRKVDQ